MQEERDCYVGQIFGMISVLRSQCEQGKFSVSAKYILYMIIVHFASLVVAYLYTHWSMNNTYIN